MKYGWILAVVLLASLIFLPRYLESCSPPSNELRFTTYHNFFPSDLAAGRLGVLRPHFRRRYLLLAYRELAGVPLNAEELTAQPADTAQPDWQRAKPWLAARKLVAGAGAIDKIDGDKRVPGKDFQSYANCLADAFNTAADTLQKRVAQWGAQSPQAAEWLRGQDQVFQNCPAGPAIPKPLPAGDKLLAADRDYQIASAEFYAEQYGQAKTDFDRVAADSASPWHDTARYVAARVCIRQGTMGKDPARLREAAGRLEDIAKDSAAAKWHAPAEGMLGFVRAQLDPQKQLAILGEQLMQPGSRQRLERVIDDYTTIWDRIVPYGSTAPATVPQDSDVANWIGAFQSLRPAADTWRARRTLPWLIAALENSQPRDPAARELVDAAHAVKPDSPAYDSVTYYGILTQIRAGELDAARTWTDAAISGKPTPSTMNLLRSERLRLARDWSEFLRFAPRRPVADSSDEDDAEEPIDAATSKRKPFALDADSVTAFNHAVPLSLWVDAARNSMMPPNLQADIAQAGWVRAVVLGDSETARTLAGHVAQLEPQLAAEMRTYLAEKDPAAAHFAAVFLMLRAPGLEPLIRFGMGRETDVMKSDIFRDNWWLLRPAATPYDGEHNHQALFDLYPDGHFGPTQFLPEAQRSAAEREWQQLTRAANSVNYLCAQTLDWARIHPQDERVPQALHLAVEATHYGPADKSSTYSHQAFDLLHRRYANSEWTRKTKYWY